MQKQNHHTLPERLLRQAEVLTVTGLSRTTLWRLQKRGTFPKARNIPGSRAIAWLSSEVEAWLNQVAA